MKAKLCGCGCGELARPDKPFAKYHRRMGDGRAARWCPIRKKYVFRYRLVMEAYIGRMLSDEEVVHHKDENPTNDVLSNLVLCSSDEEHKRLFHCKAFAEFSCGICGKIHRGEVRRKNHFCSRACWRKWKSPGRPVTTGRGLMYLITCEQCHKQVNRKGKKTHNFCSHGCYAKWMVGKPSNRTGK